MADMGTTKRLQVLLCILFLASGFTALVYQVVWVRLLTLAFGASAFAVAAVLIAFMGGMTAGALTAGQVADRIRNQLRIYAWLELAIAVYALLLPHIIKGLAGVYVYVYQQFEPGVYALSLLRLAVSVTILLVPTAAMGATLPLLCALIAQDKKVASRRTALLYGINTLGGILGCVGAGFLLIPLIGLNGTTWVAVCVNLAIAAVGLLACSQRAVAGCAVKTAPLSPESAARRQGGKGGKRHLPTGEAAELVVVVAILVTTLSGFTAMVYETIWTRVLNMVIGGTVYAFTTMLAAFLSGLMIGSLLHAWKPARRPLRALAACQLGIGLWVLLMTPHFDQLPFALLKIFEWTNDSWNLFQFYRFGMLFALLLIPTTLFGLSFPLAIGMVIRRDGETGRKTGLLYGFNTIGSVLGAFTGGFVLIPFVGLQPGLVIAAMVNVLAAMTLFAVDPERQPGGRTVRCGFAVAAALIAVFVMSPWNLSYLNSGAYVYARYYRDTTDLKKTLEDFKPIFYSEAPTGTVAVLQGPDGTLSLAVDGKTDASTGQNADMSTQMLLSHLPALFADEPAEALLVGLGSGVSLGSLLRHDVSSVDVLEISPAVVEASHCFKLYNHDPLSDPRVRLIIADGRHHLERTRRRYDLIVSEPSNPWITGVSNLFTREYYQLMASRLTPGGTVCQWVPSYHMSRETIGIVCKTFTEVFPNTSMWTSTAVGDLFLIGSTGKLELNYANVCERLARPEIRDDLARIGLGDPALLVRTFKYGPDALQDFITSFESELPINTDMHPILEFESPRFLMVAGVAGEFGRQNDDRDLEKLSDLIHFNEDTSRQDFLRRAGEMLGTVAVSAMLVP